MLMITTRLTKKRAVLAVLLLGAVLALAIVLAAGHDADAPAPLSLDSNPARVEYLASLGWDVAPEPLETLQFLLPDPLEEPYLRYNELQNAQGFDLAEYAGKQVTRWTYTVRNYPGRPDGVQLNLYVCGKLPVAGDVCAPGKDGFQRSLVYPEAETPHK